MFSRAGNAFIMFNSLSLMRKKYLRLLTKTSDRVGCDFSDKGTVDHCKCVIAQIAVCRQVLGFILLRWVKHDGW